MQKSEDRLIILEKIVEYERMGWFDRDVEDDPPTVPLLPENVDYLNEKVYSKVMTWVVDIISRWYIRKMIRQKRFIIKNTVGMENFRRIASGGAIITCNHFNPFDSFAVYNELMDELPDGVLYKVIREGNYTSFPGLYGLFFRHCHTLPLSSVFSTQKLFFSAVEVLLKRGEKILIYPEQGMWWNYRKPRPLKNGAFIFAARHNVPILPIFITMNDSDIIGQDGFSVQEYTLHILEPIYPDSALSEKKNVEFMKASNFNLWKKVYEETYEVPLVYSCE